MIKTIKSILDSGNTKPTAQLKPVRHFEIVLYNFYILSVFRFSSY